MHLIILALVMNIELSATSFLLPLCTSWFTLVELTISITFFKDCCKIFRCFMTSNWHIIHKYIFGNKGLTLIFGNFYCLHLQFKIPEKRFTFIAMCLYHLLKPSSYDPERGLEPESPAG